MPTNSPFGFKWQGDIVAGLQSGAVNEYIIPSTDSNNYFIGQAIKSTGTSTTAGIPTIDAVAATETIRGIIVGFKPITADSPVYGAASTTRVAYVVDNPYAIFIAQVNGTLAVTDIGGNADINVGSGSTVTGLSGTTIDIATIGTTGQIRILRVDQLPLNTVGDYTVVVCMINEHELKSTTGVHS